MENEAEALLKIDDLVAGYGETEILHGITIRVFPGELVAVVGPNGAGKSTLARVIAGLLTPWRGDVQYAGVSILNSPPEYIAEIGIAFLPQSNNVFRSLSVNENLQLSGHQLDRKKRARKIAQILDLFPDLQRYLTKPAAVLSGGTRQMLAVARAILLEPQILILDEPTAGLAPLVAEDLFRKIRKVNDTGVSALVIEQNVALALNAAGRAYVLADGKNRLEGTARDILSDDEIGRLYLGG